MRTRDQVRWDFVQDWLRKAQNDLQAADVLLTADLDDYESVGFHAQQAAEKFIKAILVRHQIEFPKTHQIAQLRQLLSTANPALAQRLNAADILTPHGVEFRYPGDLPLLSREHAARLLKLAEQTRKLVLEALSPYLTAGRPDG